MSYFTLCQQYREQALKAWMLSMALLLVMILTTFGWMVVWSKYDHAYTETTYTEYSIEQNEGTNVINNCFNGGN